jgi:predicted DNA-binding protein
MKTPTKTVIIRIPVDLHNTLREISYNTRKPITQIVIDAIRKEIKV